MRKFLAIVGAVTLIVGSAGLAAAIPTADPDRPGVTYAAGNPDAASIAALIAGPINGQVAGEGAAPNICIGQTPDACGVVGGSSTDVVPPTAVQHLDYLVTKLGGGLFRYEYQFENSSISNADSVTVISKFFQSISTGAGDLDVTGAHNLTGETELATACCDPASPAGSSIPGNPGTNNATWDFTGGGGILVGEESVRLILTGGPPVLVGWSATDDFSWNSGVANPSGEAGRRVLAPSLFVPVPEPASLLLVGTGLIGLGVVARRRLGKK